MIVRKVSIQNKYGLHARPAAVLARKAQAYNCAITLRCARKSADAKSILDVLSLALGPGVQVDVAATGDDADKAVRDIYDLFENGMGEDTNRCSAWSADIARDLKQQGDARCR
ncbi:HPr family phosphocarrier protein [Desulfonatronum sp. SC1]|uniref:HPr family phosphocarrier protein n=1 Tax=Desulfonatronum sp. SC1 TaxID=2109626 RepID=UPI000D30638B|nr:HPr family phosphocarrier protein [Desulfonatronum sp. SC1]PTN37171.1 HPr family phosphocarrier protein [Desulfonatronum sp. SC1]